MASNVEATNTVPPTADDHIMKVSKTFGTSPIAKKLMMKYKKRINSLLTRLSSLSGRDLQAKLWQRAITTAIFYSRLQQRHVQPIKSTSTPSCYLHCVCVRAEICFSLPNVIVLHRVDLFGLLLSEIWDCEDKTTFYMKRIRKINIHKRSTFNHSRMECTETWSVRTVGTWGAGGSKKKTKVQLKCNED